LVRRLSHAHDLPCNTFTNTICNSGSANASAKLDADGRAKQHTSSSAFNGANTVANS
jgi:hypothetical protein